MFGVCEKVGDVFSDDGEVVDEEDVLGVSFFGAFGEVEATGDKLAAVQDHHFVVGDGVVRVDEGGDAGVFQKIRGAVAVGALAFCRGGL